MAKAPQIFLEVSEPSTGLELPLTDTATHHLLHVMRMQLGDRCLVACTPSGRTFEAQVTGAANPARVTLLHEQRSPEIAHPVHSVLLALTKGERLAWACEKLTELGVEKITLFQAERSVVRYDSRDDAAHKIARLQRVTQSAAIQSRHTRPTQIEYALSLAEALQALPPSISVARLACALTPQARPILQLAQPSDKCVVAIGPEGDFTADELALMMASDFTELSLGSHVLRVETAAIAAVAILTATWRAAAAKPANE